MRATPMRPPELQEWQARCADLAGDAHNNTQAWNAPAVQRTHCNTAKARAVQRHNNSSGRTSLNQEGAANTTGRNAARSTLRRTQQRTLKWRYVMEKKRASPVSPWSSRPRIWIQQGHQAARQ